MPPRARRLVLLGSTGSIGTQTLDVVDRLRREGWGFEIVALGAGSNIDLLRRQIAEYSPVAVSVGSPEGAAALAREHPRLVVHSGIDGLCALASLDGVDIVVNALVGAVGLAPTLAALECGRTVALANKESLVIGGELVLNAVARKGGRLLPIDSEHNALFQCLEAGERQEVARLILTASGGPFLHTDPKELESVTPEGALEHPNWSMGSRITLDSATMVNKAFEVIEAHHLFDMPYNQIDVVIHPESIVHSLVEYHDGSILAELAAPEMRVPIQYALTYPDRVATRLPKLRWDEAMRLSFQPLDPERFPAFATVLAAAQCGGAALAAINAADEVLVSRFLRGEIPFPAIARGLAEILQQWSTETAGAEEAASLPRLLAADHWAREEAARLALGPTR